MVLIYSNFNKNTGISTAILQDKNGRYVGKAKVCPEDKEYESEFFGCRLAEMRATLEYYKQELKRTKVQLKPLEDLWNYIIYFDKEYSSSNTESRIEKQIKARINYYRNYIKSIKEEKKELEDFIQDSIKMRDKTIKKIKKQHEKFKGDS